MAQLPRVTQPIFASGASNIGQFGSAQAGTFVLSTNLATLMSLSAWSEGWSDAVIGSSKFPPLEEMNALAYITTSQLAYLFQSGVPEYDAGTTYYPYSLCRNPGTFQIFGSIAAGANTGHALTDPSNWKKLIDLGAPGGTVFTGSAPTGGTGNAQTLTTTTGLFTLTAGNIVDFVAGETNTAACQINVDGVGLVTIKKQGSSGLIDLAGGDITSTQSYIIVYDGVYFELQSSFNPAAFLQVANNGSDIASVPTFLNNLGTSQPTAGDFRKLKGVWGSNTTATFTADALTVLNGVSTRKLAAYNQALNSATSGAGGLDTGAIAASTWYAVYAIFNPTTLATSILMSASFTAPTLPAGYTYSALIGAIKTDGSSNFVGFTQQGREWRYKPGSNLSDLPSMASGSATLWTAIAVGSYVPTSIASMIDVVCHTQGSEHVSVSGNNNLSVGLTALYVSGTAQLTASVRILLESTNIYWYSDNSSPFVECYGFQLNI